MQDLANYIRALEGPILVTGASGFVGANLYKSLARYRRDVFAVIHRKKGWRLADVKDDFVIATDLNNPTAVKNLVESILPQTVFDCAAYGAYSFEENAALIFQTNVQGAISLIQQLAEHPISAYVHAGSSSEYGTNCAGPSENAICEPNSAYAASKVAIAAYLRFMGKHRQFPCANLRLYSVYGPLEDTSRLMPNLVKHVLQGRFPPFVNATTSRDFVYIDDVCAAFVIAAVKMNPDIYGESFNIGTGIKTTIADLAHTARRVFDVVSEPVFGAMEGRSWDLAQWYANATKAESQLGWTARTSVEAGLRATAEWVKDLTDEQFATNSKIARIGRKRSLSAVIACYKDAEAIPIMYERLTAVFRRLDIDYEILFVNDGSPDNSAEVIRQLSDSDPHVIGISHSRNFGSQMAFRSGMELSTKDGVVLLDGDLQDPPELIADFYEQWEAGHDVVYGRRVKREMDWHQGAMYKAFYRVFALLSYVKIPLDAGDFSLMDRRVVEWLLRCPERDLFMRGLRAYVGFRQTGVDYVRPERLFGRSTNNLIKNIEWAKRGIFSFSNVPLTLLTSLGILSLGLSLIAAIVVVILRLAMPELAPRGASSMLLATLAFGSLNLFAIGLVGEYVAKIMTEVKGRPRLIRSALIRHGKVTDLLPDGKSH